MSHRRFGAFRAETVVLSRDHLTYWSSAGSGESLGVSSLTPASFGYVGSIDCYTFSRDQQPIGPPASACWSSLIFWLLSLPPCVTADKPYSRDHHDQSNPDIHALLNATSLVSLCGFAWFVPLVGVLSNVFSLDLELYCAFSINLQTMEICAHYRTQLHEIPKLHASRE